MGKFLLAQLYRVKLSWQGYTEQYTIENILGVHMSCVHLNDLWTKTCDLLVGGARALGTVNHACATKCEKYEKCMYYVEGVQGCERGFEPHRMHEYGHFSQTTTHFICFTRHCCSLSYSLLSTRTSQHCGCISTFCLLFLALITTFCHFDIAIMRLLQRKCTKRFVNIF